jgi:YfiH family protein
MREDDLTDRLPATGAGFVWDTSVPPVLRPLTDSAAAAFTTRMGGRSEGPFATLNLSFVVGDERDTVSGNRKLAGASIGRDGRWSVTKQVHGSEVHRAESGQLRDGDALHTDRPQDTLAVLSADCVLVLLAGPGGVAVAHAGWRGLVAGVIENAIGVVGATEAFAGPAIGPCCFEVGPEVIDAFEQRYPGAVPDPRHVDLWAAAEAAAKGAGVSRVHTARICTSCHPSLFFSHRRDAGRTGRQALIARLP